MNDEATQEGNQQETHDAFGILHRALSDAYWAESSDKVKDQIRGISEAVYDILTELNIKDIKQRTAQFKSLKGKAAEINKTLEDFKGDINNIIHAIDTATNVTKAIEKALETGTKYFSRT